ncbi:MAG: hypothetical protein ABWY08_06080 [Comamonas sp.]
MQEENSKNIPDPFENKAYDFVGDFWWNVFQVTALVVGFVLLLILYLLS